MEHLTEACWEGYKQVGMKDKGGKMVPNCVEMDEGLKDNLKDLISRGLLKKSETPQPPDFKNMTPQQRRDYIGHKAETEQPALPLDVIAKYGKGPVKDRARFALSTPMVENELNEGEYCPRCMMEYIVRKRLGPLEEAEYQGRKVALGKPFRTPGGPKKSSVYVKNKKGNVVKVNFGDPNMKIKKNVPGRRKNFRARHRCATATDRTSARYWSCKAW
jgi:hypothetical protein